MAPRIDPAVDANPAVANDRDAIRELADELLRTELRASAVQAGIGVQSLTEEAVRRAESILSEVSRERQHLAELHDKDTHIRLQRGRQFALTAGAGVLLVLLVLGIEWGLSSWVLFVLGSLAGIGLGLSLTLALRQRRERPSEGTSSLGSSSQEVASLDEQLLAARSEHELALRNAVRAWLINRINLELGEIYEQRLTYWSSGSLAEVDDPEREVPTKWSRALEALVSRMPGGSIGIAGPRGAGKTTLIHRAVKGVDGQDGSEEDNISYSIVVDAPVEYDAREFVLHLFAKLCEAVLGRDHVNALRGRHRPLSARLLWQSRFGARPYPPALGPALIGLGLLIYAASLNAQGGGIHLQDVDLWGLGIAAAGLLLMYGTLIQNPAGAIRWTRSLFPAFRETDAGTPTATAELHLQMIWFQQSFSTGWSGALKLPFGAEAGAERGAQLAEKQLSFPDVVALYKEFVGLIGVGGQVRIGIDELDKMDDERARRFLNEIKVIFRTRGCFYLVSVSEDAMSDFERRGLPFRDVFDSSFDDVLRVGYLPLEASQALLRRRIVGLPVQFAYVCHVLGGGLARDVIRVARDVCEHEEGSDLDMVVQDLCGQQLSAKCEAARVATRHLRDPSHVQLLSQLLRGIEAAAPEASAILDRCRSLQSQLATSLGEPGDGAERLCEHREALAIALEIMTFAYYLATVQEYLPTLKTKEATEFADRAIDSLAVARQAFAVNPNEAWEATSEIRKRHLHTTPIDFPKFDS